MWTTEYVTCDECGCEVAMVTDGRRAHVSTASADSREYAWREGIVVKAQCPTLYPDAKCVNIITFKGEGESITDPISIRIYDNLAKLILMRAP